MSTPSTAPEMDVVRRRPAWIAGSIGVVIGALLGLVYARGAAEGSLGGAISVGFAVLVVGLVVAVCAIVGIVALAIRHRASTTTWAVFALGGGVLAGAIVAALVAGPMGLTGS